MPSLKNLRPGTSKFAIKVCAEVLKALKSRNIKFRAEFNYLKHEFYQNTPGKRETGLGADLLVEIQGEGGEKPQIVVIEVQG